MAAKLCDEHGKLSYRSYSAACAAAHSYSTKRDVPLRVYYDSRCCTYHLSHRISVHDFEGAA